MQEGMRSAGIMGQIMCLVNNDANCLLLIPYYMPETQRLLFEYSNESLSP